MKICKGVRAKFGMNVQLKDGDWKTDVGFIDEVSTEIITDTVYGIAFGKGGEGVFCCRHEFDIIDLAD